MKRVGKKKDITFSQCSCHLQYLYLFYPNKISSFQPGGSIIRHKSIINHNKKTYEKQIRQALRNRRKEISNIGL